MFSETECVARSFGSTHFSGDPDLLLLREDLAEEWGSVVGYLECAAETRDRSIRELFLEAAQDEMGHIIRLTRLVAVLDQVQAEELKKAGLSGMAGFEHQAAIPALPYTENFSCQTSETDKGYRTGNHSGKRFFEQDDRVLECLRNAIRDELQALNAYQRQIQAANNQLVQNSLVIIMNKKKEHVAKFTHALNDLLQESRIF